MTPHSAQAIVSQITRKGDCDGTFYAEVGSKEREFEAWFETEWEREQRYSDTHSSGFGSYDIADCRLVGAYSYDDDGEIALCGNRAEIAAMIGEATVAAWEERKSELMTEEGR